MFHPDFFSVGSGCCLSDHWRRLSSLNIEIRAQMHVRPKVFRMPDHAHTVGCAGVIS